MGDFAQPLSSRASAASVERSEKVRALLSEVGLSPKSVDLYPQRFLRGLAPADTRFRSQPADHRRRGSAWSRSGQPHSRVEHRVDEIDDDVGDDDEGRRQHDEPDDHRQVLTG